MKIKLVSCLLLMSIACTKAGGVTVNSQPTISDLTQVNMSPYNYRSSPEPTPLTIRNMLNTDQARSAGAEQIYIYDMSAQNPVRPYVRGPWNGLCINDQAIAHIGTAATAVALHVRNDEQERLRTLSATARRDIERLQVDFSSMVGGYQSQINARDISLRDAQRTIDTLRRNNFWTDVGFGLGGVLLGFGVSGIILLTR